MTISFDRVNEFEEVACYAYPYPVFTTTVKWPIPAVQLQMVEPV